MRKWESGIWEIFPSLVQSVFAENVVAVIFVISIILSLVLPENMEIKKMGECYLELKNIFNIVFTMVI